MKVLYFHQYFTTPSIGGSIRSYAFAQCLIKKGHQVTIVCGGDDEKFKLPTVSRNFKMGVVDGIRVIQIRVNTQNKDSLIKRGIDFVKFGMLGINIALREDYDILYATSTPLTAGIPGIVAKYFSKREFKFIFEVRDLWPELPKALGMKNVLVLRGMSILEKESYKKSDACIGLSPGICDGIRRRAPKGHLIEMIPNGSDTNLFHRNSADKATIKGINNGDIVAVFTGAHGIANGLDAVLDMAKVLLERDIEHVKIVFVGEGKLKPHLIKRSQSEGLNNCIFLDRVSKHELNRIMNRADIGLMVLKNIPAFYYGTSPNKFFDYISASLPIINNYPGWLADLIQQYKCGLAISQDDPYAFADAITQLVSNPEERIQMGRNGRCLAESQFNREILANHLVSFMEKVGAQDSTLKT